MKRKHAIIQVNSNGDYYVELVDERNIVQGASPCATLKWATELVRVWLEPDRIRAACGKKPLVSGDTSELDHLVD